jgi:hypothetical protein
MAKKRKGIGEVEVNPIVSNVLRDTHPRGDVICVGGFVGESPRTNHLRLFTKIDFSECLDIPLEAIVGREKVERPGIPGGTYVWVKRDANVELTVAEPEAQLSTFLQGPILKVSPAARKLSAGRGGPPAAAAAGFFSTPICTIIVSIATASLLICTRVKCPDPTENGCPEPPEPITFTEPSIVV